MKLRPCIDIHGGRVKQIVGGSIGEGRQVEENFVSGLDAAHYAALYREKGLDGGHIILLDSARSEPAAYEADLSQALAALAAFPGGMQAGGGVDPSNAARFLDAGASHVIVTSYVFRGGLLDMARLEEMKRAAGRERLVLDLSCRRRQDGSFAVVTDRWQRFTDWVINAGNLRALSAHCDEFLIHAADVEGRRGGIQEDLAEILGDFCRETGFPVTYAGGVRSLEDLETLAGLSGGGMDVTVGSALSLFGGSLDLDELAAAAASL
ncbi:MAG: phosphoribosylformimino-5-aminoimidazole carboxamide ribotide isomerase [Lachnospiraceae bacterium]|nr:phosphoribosylformimino-5-aminoimidazole carboxamide ribotide isomerase [Lachnospiraceae bacterium]